MKILAYILSTILLLTLLQACSSLDSDAKKAAELDKKSIEYIKEGDLKKAETAFQEAKQIISKYKSTEEYQKFYELYNSYLLVGTSEN